MADQPNPYLTLGVAKDASEDEIRRAYRKLAREHHPDVNPGKPEAEDKFKAIAAAYEVLSNKEKRALYDEFGHEGLRGGFDPEQARAYARYSEGRRHSEAADVPFDFDLSDLMGGGRPRDGRFPIDGQDLLANVPLDFATSLRGVELELAVPAQAPCELCAGSGSSPDATPETCPTCAGSGRTQAVRGPLRMMTACPRCSGKGVVSTPCSHCQGQGFTTTTQNVRIRIPRGAADGDELRVRGKGTPGLFGGAPGDVVIRVRVHPHPHFRREGLDLYLTLPITLNEAFKGGPVRVPTPDGPVQLKVPARAQQGTELRLRGKGVARGDARGDLYVKLEVRMPVAKNLDDEALAAHLAGTERFYEGDIREGVTL